MEDWDQAFHFLGALGGLILALVMVYLCVKYELCFCQRRCLALFKRGEEHEFLIETFYDQIYDGWLPTIDYVAVDAQIEPSNHHNIKLNDGDANTASIFPRPDTSLPLKTDANKIARNSIYNKHEAESMKDHGCKMVLSISYSNRDSIMFLNVKEITGLPAILYGVYDYVRISLALLPEKKYRSRTKLQFVEDEEVVEFCVTFKFSQVSLQTLLSSALRFRLYTCNVNEREVCIGEMVLQLADFAQDASNFVMWKGFLEEEIKVNVSGR